MKIKSSNSHWLDDEIYTFTLSDTSPASLATWSDQVACLLQESGRDEFCWIIDLRHAEEPPGPEALQAIAHLNEILRGRKIIHIAYLTGSAPIMGHLLAGLVSDTVTVHARWFPGQETDIQAHARAWLRGVRSKRQHHSPDLHFNLA